MNKAFSKISQEISQKINQHIKTEGLKEIELTLQAVEQELISSRLNIVEILVLEGRCRELRAARWMLSRVLFADDYLDNSLIAGKNIQVAKTAETAKRTSQVTSSSPKNAQITKQYGWTYIYNITLGNIGTQSIKNQTSTPLEIDILKTEKKRELLIIILTEFGHLLHDLPKSQLDPEQLFVKMPRILIDLWRSVTTKFLGKYYILNYENQDIELVNVLLADQNIVEAEILSKIPFAYDLCNYLLFESPLMIDNNLSQPRTPEAIAQAEIILHNILIQVANAVMQPLLNHFADVEEIKQKFYTYHLIATRELERFRNNLSWHYRWQGYWGEAQAIYESQFKLFTFTEAGITKIDVYAPRRPELAKLSGIPLLVTLILELQDAISPRLKAVTEFIGTGLVYILKNIVGKGIGLIGRGIIQGIGDSLNVRKVRRRSDRF
jgi:hypothetical protein